MKPDHLFVVYLAGVLILKVVESLLALGDPLLRPAEWAITAPATALAYLPALGVAIGAPGWMRTEDTPASRLRATNVLLLLLLIGALGLLDAEWATVVFLQLALACLSLTLSAVSSLASFRDPRPQLCVFPTAARSAGSAHVVEVVRVAV
jgi:hypothetical protein